MAPRDFRNWASIEHGETLGDIIGEGIDLVGEHLIAAVFVGVGLPQLSVERNCIRDYFQQQKARDLNTLRPFPA